MPSKSSRCTHNSFLRYCAHTQKCPQHVHTDGGKEFMGSFAQHLREKMVYQTFTCPYRSFQNSIVERRMLSLKQATRALMLESGLPEPFYGRAMHTASVILNLHPTFGDPVHHDKTPWDIMHPNRSKPELKVFGSLAYVLNIPKQARTDNLKMPASTGWFVGYSDHSSGYMIYDPETRVMKTRRDVHFDERWRCKVRSHLTAATS